MSQAETIKAIIFDMDDTLVSSSSTWKKAETRLYRDLGNEYRTDIALKYRGLNARDVASVIHQELKPSGITAAECGSIMRRYLIEEFGDSVTQMPGADELIRRVSSRYRLAVASGSPAEAIEMALAFCRWNTFFEIAVSSEQVPNGKPAPDVFLKAASLLALPPEACLVIEDSYHGLQAAKAAGMTCVVVPSSDDDRIVRDADCVYPSLAEVEIK